MQKPRVHRAVGLVGAIALAGAITLAASQIASASRARTASVPACTTSGLVIWINTTGNGTAGSIYYTLEFTNLSGHTCTLSGYPGVSGVDLSGHQLGSAASRNPQHKAAAVTISPRGSAHVVLRIVDALNYPRSTCAPVMAAGLRVYPPGQTASKLIPYPFLACSRAGANYLSVEAVQPGLGTVD